MKKYSVALFLLVVPILLPAQQTLIDSLQTVVSRHTGDSMEVKTLNALAQAVEKTDMPAALHYYRQATRVAEVAHDKAGGSAAISYFKLALLLSAAGQNDSAQLLIDQATRIVERHPHNSKLQQSYYNALGLFNKNLGHYDEALKYYEHIAALPSGLVAQSEVAGNYLNMANVYNRKGQVSRTQEYTFKALKIFETLKNETGIAFCYNSLGTLFYDQKQYHKAEEYLRKSLVLKQKTGNKKTLSSAHNGLAVLYMDLKDYPQALKHIDQAIALGEEFGMKERVCEGLVNKGMIFRIQGRQTEAQAYLLKARALAETLHNTGFLATINVELGLLYQDQAKKDQALASLLQGIAQAKSVKNLVSEQNAHEHLAELYYENGRFREAFEQYRTFHVLHDSLEGSTLKTRLYDMEAKYQTQKKENEIALLKKDQQLQAAVIRGQHVFQTAILVTLTLVVVIGALLFRWYRVMHRTRRQLEIERMRNHIAQDLHDDIGSTLSSINIISKMASQSPADENTASNFAQIEDHSGKMLSTMADIIWSISPGHDTLDEVLLHMKEFAAEILEPKNITYHFHESGNIQNLKIDAGIRKNLFLMFKEVLNNAMKYSHCTEIRIGLALTANRLTLDIRDDGQGFDFQEIRPGNGLNNLRERARMIQGQLEINSAPGQGTHVVIATTLA